MSTTEDEGDENEELSQTGLPPKYVYSVESYFWKGLTLGDVLQEQLVHTAKTSRHTQTNWHWRKMAERWGHARLMESTVKVDAEDQPLLDINKILRKCESETSESVTVDGSKESKDGISEEERDNQLSSGTSTQEEQSKPFISVEKGDKQSSKENVIVSVENEQPPKKKGIAFSKVVPNVRLTRPNDKCEDTSDLDFNPFDPTLRYTPQKSNVEPLYIPAELLHVKSQAEWETRPSLTLYNQQRSKDVLIKSSEGQLTEPSQSKGKVKVELGKL